jgi:hypothetical protein
MPVIPALAGTFATRRAMLVIQPVVAAVVPEKRNVWVNSANRNARAWQVKEIAIQMTTVSEL